MWRAGGSADGRLDSDPGPTEIEKVVTVPEPGAVFEEDEEVGLEQRE
jgi:hypothetical protein